MPSLGEYSTIFGQWAGYWPLRLTSAAVDEYYKDGNVRDIEQHESKNNGIERGQKFQSKGFLLIIYACVKDTNL